MIIASNDTVIDPDTVVVHLLDTAAAEGAVFRARGFGDVAGWAEVGRGGRWM